jgi:hypothetical protein
MSPEELEEFHACFGDEAKSLMFPQQMECPHCHEVFDVDCSQLGVRF